MSIISCKDLSIGYGNEIVQSDINFDINKGDYVCVIGSNGAGKSTLIKTLLGALSPICGKVIRAPGLMIGYLPQQSATQKCFPTSVYEVIMSGNQKAAGLFYKDADKTKAEHVIKILNISKMRNKNYAHLSGGQQQKVLLARALCASDDILILDEPTNGLDIDSQESFYRLIDRINKKGTTVIMISHDKSALHEQTSHVLVVEKDVRLMSRAEYIKDKEK